jgi:SAM-dependent methyltransferase
MSEFDKLRKLWPERQIFQGSARAYIRYCERWQPSWDCFEKPMWKSYFQNLNFNGAWLLDIGSGTGKLVDLLMEEGANPKDILALEPNPILVDFLYKRNLGVGCIRDDSYNLDIPILQNNEIDLITANMVTNHLSTPEFDKLIQDASGVLKLDGVLAYMVPNPYRKEEKYCMGKDDNFTVVEENAPWGGLVEYHHRSEAYEREVLEKYGFDSDVYFGGFDDTYHTMDGPKRMLVVAQKIKAEQN